MKAKDHIRWSETLQEAVERCCNPAREGMEKPFVQNGRLYATNGHILVSLPEELVQAEPYDTHIKATRLMDKERPLVRDWLSVETALLLDAVLDIDMKRGDRIDECAACGGKGGTDWCACCDRGDKCEACNGDGEITVKGGGDPDYVPMHVLSFMSSLWRPQVIERLLDLAYVSRSISVEFGVRSKPDPVAALLYRIGKMEGAIMPAAPEGSRVWNEPVKYDRIVPVPGYSDHPAQVQANG